MMSVTDGNRVQVVDLRVGTAGIRFVGSPRPRVAWRLHSDASDILQLGYEIAIAPAPDFSQGVHSSGYRRSSSPFDKSWPGPALNSRDIRWCRVRVWTTHGTSDWSAPARVEAGLLSQGDWRARPVSPQSNGGQAGTRPAALLRHAFRLDQPVVSARLYVTALGLHETCINGRPVSDDLLSPGWTAYQKRLPYRVYDVTDLLHEGENVCGAIVADGWFRGNLTWLNRRALYGKTTAFLAQLEIQLADGSIVTVATDDTWRGSSGRYRSADLYNGVEVDLMAEPDGWLLPGFDDRSWEPVTVLPLPAGLSAATVPPVRVIESWNAIPRPTSWGTLLVDAGQNVAGHLRLSVRGPRGAVITVRHAEVLDDSGHLHTKPLRSAKQTDRYVLDGKTPCTLEPAFTCHGFRFAELTCDPGVAVDEVQVRVLSSDLEQTGDFECSNDLVNRLFRNTRRSQWGNFVSLPTDCPQRDERLGWTGDIQVFATTACANADAQAFLASWLTDLTLEQRDDGCIPSTAPNVIQGHQFEYGGVGWGDAATAVPWTMYEAYGELELLRRQYPSMQAWVDWCASRLGADGLWTGDFQIGDWLDPNGPPDKPDKATTSSDFIANAYLAYSADLVCRTARLLDDETADGFYSALRDRVRRAAWSRWREHAMSTQTGCAISLELDVAPPAERALVAQALAALVERSGWRIGTGFLGTPLVLTALTRCGYADAAHRVLLNTDCPGWLYQVERGATTIWERWDAVKPDGRLHAGSMTSAGGQDMVSFNHYAYGAVVAWLYRHLAGIAPLAADPGYGTILFAPTPGERISHAKARIRTPYGYSGIEWQTRDATLSISIEVAPGAQGWLLLPPGDWQPEAGSAPVRLEPVPVAEGGEGCRLGSGRHQFRLRRRY